MNRYRIIFASVGEAPLVSISMRLGDAIEMLKDHNYVGDRPKLAMVPDEDVTFWLNVIHGSEELDALEEAGVDNWDGAGDAYDSVEWDVDGVTR